MNIAKFLLFFQTLQLMTGSLGVTDLIHKNIEKAFSAVNTAIWCNLKPGQFTILEKQDLFRAIFPTMYSTGKTKILVWKAIQLSKTGAVLFLLCLTSKEKSLLYYQLKEEFKEQIKDKKIKLEPFHFEDKKRMRELIEQHPDHHVFIDEFINSKEDKRPFELFQTISDLVKEPFFVWIAMAGWHNGDYTWDQIERDLTKAQWQIIKSMIHCMR